MTDCQTKSNQEEEIVIEGEIVSDPLKIATEFNTMFSNVFQSIHGEEGSHEIKDNDVNAIKRLSKVQSRFVFKKITTEFVKKKNEIALIVRNLQNLTTSTLDC